MKLRKANLQDTKNIAKIECGSGYMWRESLEKEMKQARKLLKSRKLLTYVLDDKNKSIAYFSISFDNKTCNVNFLAVIKKQQGKGIGTKLIRKIIGLARENKVKRVMMGVWEKNYPAISLYNKFGFCIKKAEKRYYPNGDSKLIMEKLL